MKVMKATLILNFLLLFSAAGANAASLPTGLGGLGVCTHLDYQIQDLDMLQAAGVKVARADTMWQYVEATKGQYNWSFMDSLIQGYSSHGIRTIAVLAYGNSNYSSDYTSSDFINGFTNYASTAALRYKGKGVIWELWNEPENTGLSDPDAYMGLANAVIPSIRAIDPSSAIIAPATHYGNASFIRSCFDQGLLNMVDGVSQHWYRPQTPQTWSPETVMSNYAGLRSCIADEYHSTVPIVDSEWGYSLGDGLTPQQQANYLARMHLVNLSQNIPLSIWYDWRDHGMEPTSQYNPATYTDYFGMITEDHQTKPAYEAMQLLTTSLSGKTFLSRLESSSTDWLLLFGDGHESSLAAWTTVAPHVVEVFGQSISLTGTPMYVSVPEPDALTQLGGVLASLAGVWCYRVLRRRDKLLI